MGVDPAHLLLWSELRAQVEDEDPVPASVLADAYACLHWHARHPTAGAADPTTPSPTTPSPTTPSPPTFPPRRQRPPGHGAPDRPGSPHV